jgi:hypothetical protein
MMKKLLMLPALGAAAALTYGAAAALSVDQNAAPIQVGQVTDLACAVGADIVAGGYDDGTGSVAYAFVDVTDENANCNGSSLYVTPLDGAGHVLPLIGGGYAAGRVTLGTDAYNGVAPSANDVTRYQVFFGTNGAGPGLVDAVALEGARIAIDQGPTLPAIP